MIWIFNVIVFIFGLIIGSFLNCVIYRLEQGKGFLRGRSYCPHCKHQLSWQDLIPVLSFIFLKGRCRYCKKKISIQYPLVELTTGFLFVLIFWSLGFQWSLVIGFWDLLNLCFLFIIVFFLIIIFVYDLKHYIIPDKIIYPLIGITFLYQVFRTFNLKSAASYSCLSGGNFWASYLITFIMSAYIAASLFLLIVLLSKGKAMGMGDVKLAAFMGLFLGSPNIFVALFLAFLIGAIIGIGLILAKKKTLKSEVPFGPFLIIGTFIAFFWGEIIISWYFSLFF